MKTYSLLPHQHSVSWAGIKNFIMPVSSSNIDLAFRIYCAQASQIIQKRGIFKNETTEASYLSIVYHAFDASELLIAAILIENFKAIGLRPTYEHPLDILAAIENNDASYNARTRALEVELTQSSNIRALGRWSKSIIAADGFSKIPKRLISSNRNALCFSSEPYLLDRAKELNLTPVISTYNEWFSEMVPVTDQLDSELIICFVNIFAEQAKTFNLPNIDHYASLFQRSITRQLRTVIKYLRAAEKQRKHLAKVFLCSSVGNMYNRVMAHTTEKLGGIAITHDHGSSTGWINAPELALVEWTYASKFVCYSSTQQRLLEGLNDSAFSFDKQATHFITPNKTLVPPPIKWQREKHNNRPLNILYAPSFYMGFRYYIPQLHLDLVQYDFQVKLISHLKKCGHNVILKPHPDCHVKITQQLLELTNFTVDQRPSEHAIKDADLIILDYPQSTTFRSAVLSGIPMIIYDPNRVKIANEAKALMSTRIVRIEQKIDSENRIIFNPDQLDQSITEALRRNDPTFQEHFFPTQFVS